MHHICRQKRSIYEQACRLQSVSQLGSRFRRAIFVNKMKKSVPVSKEQIFNHGGK